MSEIDLTLWLEALLMLANRPLNEEQIIGFWPEEKKIPPKLKVIKQALICLKNHYDNRAIELIELASGWQFLIKSNYGPLVSKLWEEKPIKYSRATLETLALIAYRQPITRGEIEEVRGVSISSSIIKTLLEDKAWIRIVGHRAVPGKPALFATTREFLDHFGLKSLEDLPALPDLTHLGQTRIEAIDNTLQEKLNELNINP